MFLLPPTASRAAIKFSCKLVQRFSFFCLSFFMQAAAGAGAGAGAGGSLAALQNQTLRPILKGPFFLGGGGHLQGSGGGG